MIQQFIFSPQKCFFFRAHTIKICASSSSMGNHSATAYINYGNGNSSITVQKDSILHGGLYVKPKLCSWKNHKTTPV